MSFKFSRTATQRGSLIALMLAGAISLQGCFPILVAGVGTGVSATLDRRTYGSQIEDTELEVKIAHQIDQQYPGQAHVSTTVYNRYVLLTGQIKEESAKSALEDLVRSVAPSARAISNEVVVGWPSSLSTRSGDSYITGKVKARLFDALGLIGNHVKVVTEQGVVYLMGVLTDTEASTATEAARSTTGVTKVVQFFEIISAEEAQRRDVTKRNQQEAPPPAPAPAPSPTPAK